MPNRAFVLSELLVAVSIVGCLTLLNFRKLPSKSYEDEIFISLYYRELAKAMDYRQKVELTHNLSGHVIKFNANGTIDRACRLQGENGSLVAHLGSSYLIYEN